MSQDCSGEGEGAILEVANAIEKGKPLYKIKNLWIKKIIKLITLLNREDDTVEGIISKLSEGEVNADSLKQKESFIEELLRTIPSEKTS
jgi:hypothetical protein